MPRISLLGHHFYTLRVTSFLLPLSSSEQPVQHLVSTITLRPWCSLISSWPLPVCKNLLLTTDASTNQSVKQWLNHLHHLAYNIDDVLDDLAQTNQKTAPARLLRTKKVRRNIGNKF
ncbi:hypothetical protein HanIR_Chr06g0276721 [Helianthus annuus]|nr:hypothetical protein HanIR_Chr06g0276721 [Helianthus annuus]